MNHKVGIIIVTYNGQSYIERCLTSVFNNKYFQQFDVIVVDNNSTDKTTDVVAEKFSQVELIKLDKNLGFVGGNNIGINQALKNGCDYIILLNQDTEVEYDWLFQLMVVANDDKVGIVQSMLLLGDDRSSTNNVGNALHYLGFGFVKHFKERVDSWYHRAPFEIGYASGAAMLIKREVIEKVGSLDEKFFMYHEDLDLCWRARLVGYKIIIAPQSVVYHYYEFHRNKKMFYWSERNRWATLFQNYSNQTLWKIFPILLIIEIGILIYSLFNGFFIQKIKGYIWLISNLSAIKKRRIEVQSIRIINDQEIWKHMDARFYFFNNKNLILKYVVNPVVEWYFKYICKLH